MHRCQIQRKESENKMPLERYERSSRGIFRTHSKNGGFQMIQFIDNMGDAKNQLSAIPRSEKINSLSEDRSQPPDRKAKLYPFPRKKIVSEYAAKCRKKEAIRMAGVICRYLERRGISKEYLPGLLGLSYSFLEKLSKGRYPSSVSGDYYARLKEAKPLLQGFVVGRSA